MEEPVKPVRAPLKTLKFHTSYPTANQTLAPINGVYPSPAYNQNPPQPIALKGEGILVKGHWYKRNDKAYLFDNGTKFSVKFVSIGDTEVVVQRTDGSKTKLPLGLLQDGRVALEPRE